MSTDCTVHSPLWGVTPQFVRDDSNQLAAAGAQSGGARRTVCVGGVASSVCSVGYIVGQSLSTELCQPARPL